MISEVVNIDEDRQGALVRCPVVSSEGEKMKLIVGLGNPTKAYDGTRHNVGFGVITELADKHRIAVDTKKHKALIGKGIIGGEKVILAKPQTFMNLSGESVREIVDYYQIAMEDVLIIFDDISLDVGQLRIRTKGSAGGHNGVKSIIAHLGSDAFARIKVGVGEKPAKMDLADYVLGRFHGEELDQIREGVEQAAMAAELIVSDQLQTAMNRFNQSKKKAESAGK